MTLLTGRWFEGDAPEVARELLDKVLVSHIGGHRVAGRIIEVEAYTSDDPASHSASGKTARNSVMFGPAGHLYVYLSYGMHHCINVVTGVVGDGQAVLLRAVDVIDGIETVRNRRGGRNDNELTNGPGKLGQAFGLDLGHNGVDLAAASATVSIIDDGVAPPDRPTVGPRIGITKAVDTPWRFRVPPP